jgi:hypothetical protein
MIFVATLDLIALHVANGAKRTMESDILVTQPSFIVSFSSCLAIKFQQNYIIYFFGIF